MNGFIAFGKNFAAAAADPERIAPIAKSGEFQRVGFKGDESLLGWGSDHGDIHCAVRGQKAFLVLSGCILEIAAGPDFRDQTDAAQALLKLIEGARSLAEIGEIAKRLYGSFGIVYRDVIHDVTICISDRVGSRPVWRKREDAGWIVSSHPTAIALAIPTPRIASGALGTFLLYGGAIEPVHSLYEGIEAVPPGTVVRLDEKGVQEQHAWHQFRHQPDYGRSVGDWVNHASEQLVRAGSRLARRCRKPAIFFSGGVDSRLTAAAIKAAGGDPLLVTLGDGQNLEVRVARAAAKAMKLRHEVLLRDKGWYLRSLSRAVYETGSSYVFTHGHFSAAAAKARTEFGVDTFFLGDLCEAFSKLFCAENGVGGRAWTPEEFLAAFDSIRLPLYRPENRAGTLSLLRADVRREIEASVRNQILDRYRKVAGVSTEPLIIGDHCFRWESAPTLPTFYMFLDLRSAAAERSVMFDPDVIGLLETLPAAMRADKNLGARLIHKLTPLAAWVPNSNSLLPMCWPPAAHKMSKRVKPVLGKLRRRILGDSHKTTGSWPKHSVLYVTDPAWRAKFSSVLENGDLFDDTLFDRDAVRQCWRSFINGDATRGADVEKLAQLGLAAELLDSGWSRFAREFDSPAPSTEPVMAAGR